MPPREAKRARKNQASLSGGGGSSRRDGDGEGLRVDDGSSDDSGAAEAEGGDASGSGSAAAAPDNEVLADRCAAYVDLNRQIKDLASKITALRKTLKTQEKDLLEIMQNIKLEEINVDGVKITRIKRLHINDDK